MTSEHSDTTFCNIYTSDGIALSNKVLSGQADVPNLFQALESASFEDGASANHLLGIINDILDMSRIESGRMIIKREEFSFHE